MGVSAQDLLAQLRAEQQSGPVDAKTLLEQLRAEQGSGFDRAARRADREVVGGLDTALSLATSGLAMVPAGIRGAYDLLTGKGASQAVENIQSTQEALTWSPKTAEGQRNVEAIGHGFETGKKAIETGVAARMAPLMGKTPTNVANQVWDAGGAGNAIIEAGGSPALATLANMGVDVALLAPQLAGLRGPSATAMPRTSLTGVEKQVVKALEADATPEALARIRGAANKRDAQIEVLRNAEQRAQQLGPEATVADTGEANARALAQAHGAVSSTGKQLRAQMAERQVGVRDRMVNFLDQKLFKGREYEKAIAETDNVMRKSANPLYRKAYDQKVRLTQDLQNALSEPAIMDAVPEAIRLIKAEPTITRAEIAAGKRGMTREEKIQAAAMFQKGKGGWTVAPYSVNMRGLDFLKRGMDQLAGKVGKKRAQEAAALGIQAAKLRDAIVGQNGKYGEALSVWSTGKKAIEAAESGSAAFRQLANGTKSAETLTAEFSKLNANEQALYRIGAADYLRSTIRRKPDLKSGETPSSVYTTFAGSPAQRDLLRTIFEKDSDFGAFQKLMDRENAFSDTLKAVNVGDATERLLQSAYSAGRFTEQLTRMSTDALYAASGNRYAMLGLIQNAVMHPGQFLRSFKSAEAARLSLGQNAQSTIREMLDVLEAKQAINGKAVNGMARRMARVAQIPPKKMYNWLKDEKHRRELYALGTAAVIAEKQNGQ